MCLVNLSQWLAEAKDWKIEDAGSSFVIFHLRDTDDVLLLKFQVKAEQNRLFGTSVLRKGSPRPSLQGHPAGS